MRWLAIPVIGLWPGANARLFFDFTSRESGRIVFNLRHRPMRIPMPTVVAGTGAARATGRLLLRELRVEDVVVCVILGRHQDRGRGGRQLRRWRSIADLLRVISQRSTLRCRTCNTSVVSC
jgi:hypothetical protein